LHTSLIKTSKIFLKNYKILAYTECSEKGSNIYMVDSTYYTE